MRPQVPHAAPAPVPACKTRRQRVLSTARSVMRRWIVCSIALFLICTSGLWAQSAFQNLDFESANVAPIPAGQYGGLVPITNAIPFWTGYLGTNQWTQVLQNNLTLGQASIGLYGPVSPAGVILQGQYTVVLQAGFNPFDGLQSFVGASLAQVGLVPANANSILLDVVTWGTNFTLSFAGQGISLSPVGSGPNYTVYGGNIAPFSGQAGELKLTILPTVDDPENSAFVDAISFSTQPIPEPSALSLLLAGITALILWHRRTCRKPA